MCARKIMNKMRDVTKTAKLKSRKSRYKGKFEHMASCKHHASYMLELLSCCFPDFHVD